MRLLAATILLTAALVFLAFGLPRFASADSVVRIGKAEYGYGQIRYGGKGPEAWRWDRIIVARNRDDLQHRVTELVLENRSLRRQAALLDRLNFDALLAIKVVFGPYASQAIAVSSCETGRTFYTGSRNGQYLGLFQMGSSERRTYGHGSTALAQARAAYAYFVASGRDWSPWECKP